MGFLGSIGKVISKVLPKLLPAIAGGVLLGPIGGMAIDLFKQVVGGGLLNKTGAGGLFSGSIPLSLPNPLSVLNPLLGGIAGSFNSAGDFLNNIGNYLSGNRNIGGQQITVPQIGDRGQATFPINYGNYGGDGGYGGYPQPVGGTGGGVFAQVGNTPLFTPEEQADMAKLKPEDQAMMRLQRTAQRYNQMLQLFTNLMQMDHEAKMAVIRNVRA